MLDTQPFINIGATAGLYSQIAGVLAGFAFTTLLSYLGRQPEDAGIPAQRLPRSKQSQLDVRQQVTVVLFNTLGGLVVCAVLYGMLAGGSPDSGNSLSGMMVNGPAFCLAILGIFFCTALVATPFTHLEPMLASARVLLGVVGPTIAMLLVAGSSMDLSLKECLGTSPAEDCRASSQVAFSRPYGLGIGLTLLLAFLALTALIVFWRPTVPPPSWTARAMAHLIIGVPAITVVGAIAVATMPADFLLPDALQIFIEVAAFVILALFAALAARTCHHHPPSSSDRANESPTDVEVAG
ncbi:hypothetical protein AB0B68_17090 [Micromonospora sp. NPDC049049]|uniref:hypothetical protein n=1 Tax=Micromonospora sp. NPDC049049 TaxID=3155495 RepID=UPI0033C7B095